MPWAVLGLGTNLGARRAILESAIALLGPCVRARSQLYATPPLGPPQPDYLNAAVRVAWDGEVEALLALTQRVEAQLGRERIVKWGPRTLDIDILHWSEGEVALPHLHVPHRELVQRAFALAPLLDVAPELADTYDLEALGGAPPRAVPGWSAYERDGDSLRGEWLEDTAELASQLVSLLVASTTSSAPGWHTLSHTQGVDVRSLHGPRALYEGGRSWIEVAARDAWASGFAVRGCAVLACDEASLRGVLLGVPGRFEDAPARHGRLEGKRAQRWVIDSM